VSSVSLIVLCPDKSCRIFGCVAASSKMLAVVCGSPACRPGEGAVNFQLTAWRITREPPKCDAKFKFNGQKAASRLVFGSSRD
jgi:hypothetical protein